MSQRHCNLYFTGVNSKKILLPNTPSLDVPVTAERGKVKDASCPLTLIYCYYELRRTARHLERGMKSLLLHNKTRNVRGLAAFRQVAKLPFMRYIGS